MSISVADIRKEYKLATLDETSVLPDPIRQFEKWMHEAITAKIAEPTAMTVATAEVQTNGIIKPTARIVLLKGYDANGFVFFTNYQSNKAQALETNSCASLLFHWIELERQVRIEGRVEKVSNEESDAYFLSRPLLSRLGAWASHQSKIIANRDQLEKQFAIVKEKFGNDIPRPPHWGGYRVIPHHMEFWQGRESRLHDRICFQWEPEKTWKINRLSP